MKEQRGNSVYWAEMFLKYENFLDKSCTTWDGINERFEELSAEQISGIKEAIREYKSKIQELANCLF